MHPLLRGGLAATGLTLLLCGPAAAKSVDLRFAAVAGNAPVACGTPVPGLGTTGQTAAVQDLRFFVSNVRLHRANGRSVAVELRRTADQTTSGRHGVTLIDLEDGTGACADGTPATNASVRGTVPKGRYTGVSWTVGVPFALNHTDAPAAPRPLNSAAMAWSWQAGRKFTKIELAQPQDAPAPWAAPAFFVHLGSTGCEGNPATGDTVRCQDANRARVRLDDFDPKRQAVALDLAQIVKFNDITVNGGNAPGCMSGPTDPECQGVFGAFGLDWKADGSGDGTSTGEQYAFRAVKR